MKSMTGFGRGESRGKGFWVVVEVGSVNRKQLDVRTHLPRPWQALEPRVAALARGKLSRGQISLTVRVQEAGGQASFIDENMAAARIAELRRVAKRLKLPDDMSASSLPAMSDLLRSGEVQTASETLWPLVERALRDALRKLDAMKKAEGAALKKNLLLQLRALRAHVGKIKARAPKVTEKYRKNLRKRLEKTGVEFSAMDPALAREVAVFAEKSDIAEELARLESHFSQWESFVASSKSQGRSLDFLCQEMFRELNTIGAKANDAAVARQVVNAKTALDRMREQVQNVE